MSASAAIAAMLFVVALRTFFSNDPHKSAMSSWNQTDREGIVPGIVS
jgi:hypothetical protein